MFVFGALVAVREMFLLKVWDCVMLVGGEEMRGKWTIQDCKRKV